MRHNSQGRRGGGGGRHRGHGGGGMHRRSGGGNGSGGGGQNRMQVFDSNGPEVRIRGTAYQICEKYMALAKDAASMGDRVLSESYLQHAEHYQRMINSWHDSMPQQPVQQQVTAQGDAAGKEGGEVQVTASRGTPAATPDLGLPASILGAGTRKAEVGGALEDA